MKTDIEVCKEKVIDQYCTRRANSVVVDNIDLYAEMPMFFHCDDCGVLLEVLVEDYIFQPLNRCSQCKGLREMDWMDDAIREYNKRNE